MNWNEITLENALNFISKKKKLEDKYCDLVDFVYLLGKLTGHEDCANNIVEELDKICDEYVLEDFRQKYVYNTEKHHIPLYFVEVGVLLKEDNEEFEDYQISDFYDDKFGFYDENKLAFFDLKEAMDYARKYAEKGVINTYAFVYYDRVNVDEMSDHQLLEILNCRCVDDMPIVNKDSLIWFISKDEHKEVVGWYLDEHKAE